jgi:hypothetical protein
VLYGFSLLSKKNGLFHETTEETGEWVSQGGSTEEMTRHVTRAALPAKEFCC